MAALTAAAVAGLATYGAGYTAATAIGAGLITGALGMQYDSSEATKKQQKKAAAAAAAEEEAALASRRASLLKQKTALSKTSQSSASAGGTTGTGTSVKSEYTGTLLG